MNKLTFAFDVELDNGEKILKGTKVLISNNKPNPNGCKKRQEIINKSTSVIVPEYLSNGKIVKHPFEAGFTNDCFIELQ